MGKGGYNGGSTIIRPGSDWFGKPKGKKKKPVLRVASKLSASEKEARLETRIKAAAERLAKLQAEFDAGKIKPPEFVFSDRKPKKKKRKRKGKKKS